MLILSKISRSFFSFVSVTPTTDIGKYNSDSILTRLSKLACKLLILQFKKESENDKDDDNASWDCELPRRFGLMTGCGGEYLHTYVEKLAMKDTPKCFLIIKLTVTKYTCKPGIFAPKLQVM